MRRLLSVLFGLAALVLAGLAVSLCVYAGNHQAEVPDGEGGPTETLSNFLFCLQKGDWSGAEALMDGASLGLAETPEEEINAMFWEAQRKSWDFRIEDGYTLLGGELQKTVQVSGMMPEDMAAPLQAQVQEILRLRTEEARLASEIYDETGAFRSEVAYQALTEAVALLMSESAAYSRQQSVTVRLHYDEALKQWRVLPSEELLRAMTGGAGSAPMQAYNMRINNLISTAMDGVLPIEKVYWLDENQVVAPVPDADCFGVSSDPADTANVIADATKLLDGQELIWSPETKVAPGSQVHWYLDDTILSVTWKQGIDNAMYTFSEIKIAHPSQFRRYFADNTFSAARQYKPSEMARAVNAVTAQSGDFHKFRNMGIIVYQRQLYRCLGQYLDTCMVDGQGNLNFVMAGELTQEADVQAYIEENDILFSLAFGPVLLQDGQRRNLDYYPIGEIDDYYARSVICQVDDLHYLLVTVNTEAPFKNAATAHTLCNALEAMGVQDAYVLDGGQTAAIITGGELINAVQFGSERAISDIIYFATAIPSEEGAS